MRGIKAALRHWFLVLRSSWIGTALGAVPGVGVSVIDWIAYGMAVRTARNPENFGRGDIRGVIAPEASNNAKDGGSLLPTLTLGIPGSLGMALVLGAFMIHGVAPGPDMIHDDADITYMLVWGLMIANIIGAGICLAFTPQLSRVLDIPAKFLIATLLMMVLIGAFQGTQSLSDLWLLLIVGGVAYIMKTIDWPRPPLILGFVLGDIIERYLFISVQIYDWGWLLRPGVMIILAMAAFVLLRPLVRRGGQMKVSFEGASGELSRGMAIANVAFSGVAALLVAGALIIASGWSQPGRMGPMIIGTLALALLVGVAATSALAVRRAHVDATWRSGTGRGFVVLAIMAGYILVAAVIGMLPALLVFVPAAFLFLGGRLGWSALFLTIGLFVFSVVLFDWLLALPWPKPLLPQFQELIFNAVH